MLILEALVLNLALMLATALLGWFPMRFSESRTRGFSPAFRLFAASFLGFLLVQSLYAIVITRGLTMQWLNFLPILFLAFLPAQKQAPLTEGEALSRPAVLALPLLMCLVATGYFVYSYAPDFQTLQRYPFIDLISYGASAYGMGQAKAEFSFSDTALYFPESSRLNLYHFTELWFTRLVSALTGKTEVWLVAFVLPVFLLTLLAMGMQTLFRPGWTRLLAGAALVLAAVFAYAKLLVFDDLFFYHVLDLCGIKISLIIPTFLFLWGLRHQRPVALAFLLILPQVNILLSITLALLAFYGFFIEMRFNRKALPRALWLIYGLYGLLFLILVKLGGGSGQGPERLPFSGIRCLQSFFTYSREAFFNLGYNYWLPFLALAALFRSRIYGLLPLPYALAKGVGKGLALAVPGLSAWSAGAEVVVLLAGLFWLNRRFFRFPPALEWAMPGLLVLCATGALGYAFTGFMDFEQIYTLTACSLFFILAVSLFLLPTRDDHPALLAFPGSSFLLVACLGGLVWKTGRLQRVLPFDTAFYDTIGREAGPVTRSIYLSTMAYTPFPLHVKAGFPLLFHHPDAHSTPVTAFEDSSWQGRDIAWHVMQYPFTVFCGLPENRSFSPDENKARFVRKYGIRFAWVDAGYPEARLRRLRPAVVKIWRSDKDKKELWKLDPERLP